MDIQLTDPQFALVTSEEPYPAFVGGYGSGKSFALIVRAIVLKLRYPQQSIAYYLPTYDLCRVIGFPRFAEQLDAMGLVYVLNKTFATIEIEDCGQIIFRTLDAPERIVGFEVADSFVDELDTLPKEKARDVWNKILARNRQKKPDGAINTVACGSTPEGYGLLYEMWKRDPKPGYELIRAPTSSNARNLPEGYIQSLRDIYPPQLLEAYLEGNFVNLTSGSVYPTFDRQRQHADAQADLHEPLHIGMDFNVMNMTAIASVIRGGTLITVNELTKVRDTPSMIALIKERWPHRTITVYPDASGNSRKSVNAQESDLILLKNAGFVVKVNPSNPPVKDRVNAVNALMPRWMINTHNCPVLTESLEQQAYDKNGEPDKTSGHDHATEAAGYKIHQLWPVKRVDSHTKPAVPQFQKIQERLRAMARKKSRNHMAA